ncbi:twitching motility protein PilT [Candidatus Poriferisocius sp.]|uniref:twitching motility protein PilT n=1 Tax=Candidatus Poriferisocius sp. TaxID=3101276 RepID=UPI003B016C84
MTVFVLDAGELIGLDNDSRAAWARLHAVRRNSDGLIVPTGVIGQVWRGTPQQARLNQALKQCKLIPLNEDTARLAGYLCRRTGISDVIDAVVAAVARSALRHGEASVLTSGPKDISALLAVLNSTAKVVPV